MFFHVRRTDREITDPVEIRRVLKTAKYVTLAFCMDNEPYLVALSHGYDEQKSCLYFHCASEGKKLTYLAANNRVWGEAILNYGATDDCDYDYKSVHFSGEISVITDLAEKQHAMEVLVYQVSSKPKEKLAKIKSERLAKTTMLRLNISYLSGKKHQSPKTTLQ